VWFENNFTHSTITHRDCLFQGLFVRNDNETGQRKSRLVALGFAADVRVKTIESFPFFFFFFFFFFEICALNFFFVVGLPR
jgi:hypothetical protein